MKKQKQMDLAFDNYLTVSKILREDIIKLLSQREETDQWQRRFIKELTITCEAFSACYRGILEIDKDGYENKLSKNQLTVLEDERSLSTDDRLKYTLTGIHKVLSLEPIPNFGQPLWESARKAILKRDQLTHPKDISSLLLETRDFEEYEEGLTWLYEQHSNVLSLIQEKHKSLIK